MVSYVYKIYIMKSIAHNECSCEINLYKMSDVYGQIKKI
jgi:hypothetical protein